MVTVDPSAALTDLGALLAHEAVFADRVSRCSSGNDQSRGGQRQGDDRRCLSQARTPAHSLAHCRAKAVVQSARDGHSTVQALARSCRVLGGLAEPSAVPNSGLLSSERNVRKTSISVEIEIKIERPAEEVWAFVSDLTRLPEWLGEFVTVVNESAGPVGTGSIFRYTVQPGRRSATLELVEWQPGRRLAWDGPPLPWVGGAGRPRGSFEVQPLDERTTRFLSRYEPELSGTMTPLRPYMRRWLHKQRVSDTERLKRLLEAAAR